MGYYLRYFVECASVPTLDTVARAFDGTRTEFLDGTISSGGRACGAVEITLPEDEIFADEIDEFREFLSDLPSSRAKQRVLACLDGCQAIVGVQVLFGSGDTDSTVDVIAPLWRWLFKNHPGLRQADGEGFYEGKKLILPVS